MTSCNVWPDSRRAKEESPFDSDDLDFDSDDFDTGF